MRIEKVTIVDFTKNNETFVFGPILGSKSVILIGDDSKNTWLHAIGFAFGYCNEISSLPPEFRNFNGSVEVVCVISSTDEITAFLTNLVGIDVGNTISLRRSVQSRQFEYFLCGLRVERTDMKHFLEICGFSHSYSSQYSVDCNQILALEMSDSNYRLHYLENCCGLDEYREKRDKSKRILRETEDEIRRIDLSLEKINVQLNIFASNESQQIYQQWIIREKELGHFRRLFRIKKLQADLEKLNNEMDTRTHSIEMIKTEIIHKTNDGKAIRSQCKELLDKISALKVREHNLEQEVAERQRYKTVIEGTIQSLDNSIHQSAFIEDLSVHEMNLYRAKFERTNSQMSEFDVELERLSENKSEIDQQISALESQAQTLILNSQQNQRLGTKFDSIIKRNEYLLKLIKKTKGAITRENKFANGYKAEIQSDMTELQQIKVYLMQYNEELVQMNADDEISSFHEHKVLFDNLEDQRCELSEQNVSLMERSHNYRLSLEEVYDKFRQRFGNSIFKSFKSMDKLMQSASTDLNSKYFGRVIDNFTCNDPDLYKAISDLMGEYLFYHIVDSPQTALQILSGFNEKRLAGRVEFFVLSIVDTCGFVKDEVLKNLTFDTKFQKVFEKIAEEKSFHSRLSNKANTNDVDSDYETFEENGALRVTQIAKDVVVLYQEQEQLADMADATRYELCENSCRMEATLQNLIETSEFIDNKYETINQIQQIQSSQANATQSIVQLEARILSNQAELEKHEAKLKELNKSKDQFEKEMKLNLLTDEEKNAIALIQTEIVEKKAQLQRIFSEYKELQTKRNTISDIREQSFSRYSDLQQQSQFHADEMAELDRNMDELSHIENLNQTTDNNLNDVHAQLNELQKNVETQKTALSDLEKVKLQLQEKQKSVFGEMNTLECQKKNMIEEIAYLKKQKPYDATQLHNPDILEMSEHDVDSQLHIAQHQLRTYQNTNHFDLDLLDTFTKDRENFNKRRTELANLECKIASFMNELDIRINATIKSTFDDMAKHFSEFFSKFVRYGSARLELVEEMSNRMETDDNPNTNDMVGIHIFTKMEFEEFEKSFADVTENERKMIALVFIISMQKLCPAPFYLYDSINKMISEPFLTPLISHLNDLSNGSQVIATTVSHAVPNGPDFIDNIFRSSNRNGKQNITRISYDEAVAF